MGLSEFSQPLGCDIENPILIRSLDLQRSQAALIPAISGLSCGIENKSGDNLQKLLLNGEISLDTTWTRGI
jgi:hypothetical protein